MSPTHTGLRRGESAVFPRAKRDVGRPPVEVGDIAQNTVGSIGSSSDVLSSLRRPPTCHIPASTREQELRRFELFDPTGDKHGPADYHTETINTSLRSPSAVFGSAQRTSALLAQMSLSPGPGRLVCQLRSHYSIGHA